MNKQLHKLAKLRGHVLNELNCLSTAQLNVTPKGFNNNIIWNLGHLVAASQLIFYKRAALLLTIDEQYIVPFLPGTKPNRLAEPGEIKIIKELAVKTLADMQTDYETKTFTNYTKSENIERVYGIEVLTIEDAIHFLL
ncbi:MAG: DinB family protein [Chitinophagaceae bacterium]